MTPLERYQNDIQQGHLVPDEAQQQAILLLELTYQKLCRLQNSFINRTIRRVKQLLGMVIPPVTGLYMWGGVGRGKTCVMDLFFEAIPFKQKKRLHFYHFMQHVNEELKKHQGEKDPLKIVAKNFGKSICLLCFDEFFVNDIADAMIMAKLFEYLFDEGICLITTSNIPPDNLYHNGLQRNKFLPTIDLIKKHTTVFELDSQKDYRLEYLEQVDIFHTPLDKAANKNLKKYFEHLAFSNFNPNQTIEILHRHIQTIMESDNVVWFDFKELCQTPRSQYDYIEIAKLYQTILISNVKIMTEAHEDVARRFIMMIDAFYDHRVAIIMSLESQFQKIYQGKKLKFEFKRTLSRLQEMQSKDYLSSGHVV